MRVLIIYNPNSGNQKTIKNISLIKSKLSLKYNLIEVFASNGAGSIIDKVEVDGSNYELLVICGGDGTLNEAVNGLMKLDKKPKIAYIPSGTTNDTGKLLGLSKRVIKKSLDIVLNGNPVEMDICKAEDKYFVYASAIGKYTNISYKASSKLKKKIGHLAYFVEALNHLADENKMHLTIEANQEIYKGDYYTVLALNSERLAGFRFYRSQRVKLNDGIIDITLVRRKNVFSLFSLLMFFFLGDRWKNGVHTIRTNKIVIKSIANLSYNTDGEHAFDSNSATIVVVPKAITILVSEKIKKRFFE